MGTLFQSLISGNLTEIPWLQSTVPCIATPIEIILFASKAVKISETKAIISEIKLSRVLADTLAEKLFKLFPVKSITVAFSPVLFISRPITKFFSVLTRKTLGVLPLAEADLAFSSAMYPFSRSLLTILVIPPQLNPLSCVISFRDIGSFFCIISKTFEQLTLTISSMFIYFFKLTPP